MITFFKCPKCEVRCKFVRRDLIELRKIIECPCCKQQFYRNLDNLFDFKKLNS